MPNALAANAIMEHLLEAEPVSKVMKVDRQPERGRHVVEKTSNEWVNILSSLSIKLLAFSCFLIEHNTCAQICGG